MAVKTIKRTKSAKPSENKDDFSGIASQIIEKGIKLINRRFDRALSEEEELDAIIDELSGAQDMPQAEKNKLIQSLRALQLYDIKTVSSVIASLYDKRGGAEEDGTQDLQIDIKLPKGAEDYAE